MFPRTHLLRILLAFLFLAWTSVSGATTTPAFLVTANGSGQYLNSHLSYYVDNTDSLSAEDVLKNVAFLPTNGRTGLGLEPHTVWLRVDLTLAPNASNVPERWWVEYLPYSVHSVQFFEASDGHLIPHAPTGEGYPHSTRPFSYRQYLWPVSVPHGKTVTLLWKTESFNTHGIPIRLWQFEHWSEQTIKETLGLGICFGIMLGLALYNLLLWFRLSDRLYLLYSAQILSYFIFAADLHGYLSQFVLPESIHLLTGRSQALTNLYGMFACAFAWKLLDAPQISRWWGALMRTLIVVYVGAVIAALTGFAAISGAVMQFTPMIWIPVVLGVGVYRSVQGYRPAMLYLAGYGPLLAGLVTLLAFGEGTTDGSTWVQSIYLVTGAWEAMLFSQALAWRIVGLIREREQALEQAAVEKAQRLTEALAHESMLKARVEVRTAELAAEVNEHRRTTEQLRESQKQLEQLAYYDALTGLPNRRMFEDRFQMMLKQCEREERMFVLVIADLDRLKVINDAMGHDAGDAMIAAAGQRIRRILRAGDTVARLGGDEFALILGPQSLETDVQQLRQRIREEFADPIAHREHSITCAISIGLARYPYDGKDFSSLYWAADKALYAAKRARPPQPDRPFEYLSNKGDV